MAIDWQVHLDNWEAAYIAVSSGQSYTMNGRSLTLADADTIKEQIEYCEARINQATTGSAVNFKQASFV